MGKIILQCVATLVAIASCAPTWGTPAQSVLEQVRTLLHEQAREQFPNADLNVVITPLDPRLSLTECTQLVLTPRAQQVYGRIPVAAQCHAPHAWSVFLTGEVSVVLPVVVTRDGVARGTTLTLGALALEARDLGTLRNQYLTSLDRAVGQETRSALRADQVVYATQLKQPLAVRRGERVTILADRGAVRINAQGEALQNGMAGTQIRVKNLQSERVVRVWVRAQGLVATSP